MSEKDLEKEEILSKEIDEEELKEVTGATKNVLHKNVNKKNKGQKLGSPWSGDWGDESYFDCPNNQQRDDDPDNCVENNKRNIYVPKFPNCAATVGDGSWCGTNDACYSDAVDYQGMVDCSKAWR